MIIKLENFKIVITNKNTKEIHKCNLVICVSINQSIFDKHIGYMITIVDNLTKYAADNINLNPQQYEIKLIYCNSVQPVTFKHITAVSVSSVITKDNTKYKYTFLFD